LRQLAQLARDDLRLPLVIADRPRHADPLAREASYESWQVYSLLRARVKAVNRAGDYSDAEADHRNGDRPINNLFEHAVAHGPAGLSGPRFAIWFDISDRLIGRRLDRLVAQSHWTASLDGFTNAVGVK
jgi:hypothetical protein